jgi:hypothetical protein
MACHGSDSIRRYAARVRWTWAGVILVTLLAGVLARLSAPGVGSIPPSGTADTTVTVIVAADVAACWLPGARQTARILAGLPGTILLAGDAAYQSRRVRNPLKQCYEPTWGPFKSRTYVVPGNHEYESGATDEFFRYFGVKAGPPGLGYFSFDLGAWHIVALNSNAPFDAASTQGAWLARDLAGHPTRCTLAFFHHPRFTSGLHGGRHRIVPLWQLLERGGVDIAVAGHDHIYERFAPMTSDGRPSDTQGIRQFVVGTGGGEHAGIGPITANSEARATNVWGVLKLTLGPASYAWQFIPTSGDFRDRGGGACH